MRKGRILELIVKDIKTALNPNAVIQSPEYVPDSDTGTRREVDIGIRRSTDTNDEVFIAVECRDRGKTEDITWIEQLITKKKSINADVLIAVTSAKFSGPAKEKALKNNILIRDIEQFSIEEVNILLSVPYVKIRSVVGMDTSKLTSIFCPDIFDLAEIGEIKNFKIRISSYPVISFYKFKDSQNGNIIAELYEFERLIKFIVPVEEDNTLIIDLNEWKLTNDGVISTIDITQSEINPIANLKLLGDFKSGKVELWGIK